MRISKMMSILLGLGSLHPLWAQSCPNTCTSASVCSKADIDNKTFYQRCVAQCEAKCYKCVAAVDTIFPKYYVLGLLYSPPGCTSTATQTCTTPSTVDYGSGSTMGTKTSIQSSKESAVDLKVSATFGGGDSKATSFGVSATTGYSTTTTDSNSTTISKASTSDVKATGNGDGVDHDQDLFILLLNPAIAVQQVPTFSSDQVCTAPASLNWYFGVNPAIGNGSSMTYTVSVGALKNPQANPTVIQQLTALNFTQADFNTLLALDPFANGSTTIDTTRYSPTTANLPYEPPDTTTECNKGICTCSPTSISLKNELLGDVGTSTKTDYSVGFSESLTGTLTSWLKLGASSDQTFTWTTTATTDNTTDSSQTASLTMQCPSSAYTGPTEMLVYWDNLFGSFLFVPAQLGSAQVSTMAQGSVTAQSGQPGQSLRGQPVTLSLAGKTYRTTTDSAGNYAFGALPGMTYPTSGTLSVMGVTQTVAVNPTSKINVQVP